MIDLNRRVLGTMDGEAVMLPGNDDQSTYARHYWALGGSDKLRKKFLDCNAEECIRMGYEHTKSPHNFYFRVVKEWGPDDPERLLSCYAYALGTFANRLEAISGIPIKTFQRYLKERNIDPIVRTYFNNVEEPQDGDLAVYSVTRRFWLDGAPVSGIQHAGIYRLDADGEECIESKWGVMGMPYVFRHTPFLVSPIDGDEIKFYRLKDSPVEKNDFAHLLEEEYSVGLREWLDRNDK